MMKNRVYIAGIKNVFPQAYPSDQAVDLLYPVHKAGKRLNQYAKKVAKFIGIEKRFSVLDEESFPTRKLSHPTYHPLHWGKKILEKISDRIDLKEIGFVSVSYNITSHINVLPNLACQLTYQTNLELDQMPEEIAYYGCAGGLFSLKSAVEYCAQNRKAAYIYNFDQCSWIANPIFDQKHPDFKVNLISSLLFSDAGVGILVIPENMKHRFQQPLMEIVDYQTDFQLGTAVGMRDGYLTLGEEIKNNMPDIISEKLIKPILKNNNLAVNQVQDWSLHQGGLPILQSFTDEKNLNLTNEQIKRSKQMFQKHGNLSSPSAFVVLESFFQQPSTNSSYGIIASFGAGYYLGTFLYRC